jgi:hypothetical protein
MSEAAKHHRSWWAEGLLFENCNCTLVCPGHVHFSKPCSHDRCLGYWAIRFDRGECQGVALAGVRVAITYDSPQHMIEGNWIQRLIIDRDASAEQRRVVEEILTGALGGPWKVLAQFVGSRLPTEYRAIRIEEETREKRLSIEGLVESTLTALKGRDRSRPVLLSNMFNQIHAPEQELALGASSWPAIGLRTEGTHALASRFSWRVD